MCLTSFQFTARMPFVSLCVMLVNCCHSQLRRYQAGNAIRYQIHLTRTTMDFTDIKQRATRALADISPPTNAVSGGECERHELSNAEFPVPELILFGLRNLRDLQSWGPGEKCRWGVTATFRDVPFSVSLEKFGLRLYTPKGLAPEIRNEIIHRLATAATLSEAWLRDIAGLQIREGNVTIENQYHYFDGAYRFFREKASIAYETPPPNARVTQRDENGQPMGWLLQPWRSQIEGGYLAGAMIDAYFSRLEHVLVLVLPFLDFDPSAGALVEFVGSIWGDKWRQVFDLAKDQKAKLFYDQLKDIKETVRNPLSHGGFAKKGMSFFFHVEKIGALPALLTKHGHSCELLITPVPQGTYQDLCVQLDETDEFLADSFAGAGIQYAKAGLDVAFSADFRQACKEAAKSPKDLQDFIEHEAYVHATHANMDY
jgi:hypothetical protein